MLDGILGLGRGFSSKCKSLIKPTRTRIDVLRGRKEATQRFLKNNLAQLLVNGHDMDAYGRTEEYLAELNLMSCYDFIEQSCLYILKQLSVMQKQSECPEECREAVGSLMFAAARFSDFPELRDLRDTFQERYGTCLEHFVNPKFVENLTSRPSTVEKKIKLLQDIALEISINWDSNSFEQRIVNPCAYAQSQPKYGPIHDRGPKDNDAIEKIDKRREESSKERNKLTSYKSIDGNLLKREDLDQTTPKREKCDIAPQPKLQPTHGSHELFSSNGREDSADKSIGKRGEFVDKDRVDSANSTNKLQQEERETLKSVVSNVPPPPYMKSRDKLIPPPYIKSVDGRHGVEQSYTEPAIHKGENGVRGSSSSRHEVAKGSSSRRRRDTSKTGLQILIQDKHHGKDEEEMAIDRLLLHYSKKSSTYDESEIMRRKSKKTSHRHNSVEDGMYCPPTRSVSLPRGQIAPTEASAKVYTRANSFQLDKSGGHVHPKLPDYDDLAARLAALRGR